MKTLEMNEKLRKKINEKIQGVVLIKLRVSQLLIALEYQT